MKNMLAFCCISIIVATLAPIARTEPVRNGNELALAWSTNNAAGRQAMQKQAVGIFHTFRYLRVNAVRKDQPVAGVVTVMTTEPSSDMRITLVLAKQLSLELAAALTTNDSVAAYGRIKSIGLDAFGPILVDPALLKHKDRSAPKLTKELLHEVDPTAY